MRKQLEEVYIPTCNACQHNKSFTAKCRGPLHPLPIPDGRGDSVAIDFIGPLLTNHGFNCIVTMIDRLNSDVHIIPTNTDLTAEKFVTIFFNHWYCNNGLPLENVSDWDHLFLSRFWQHLHELSGVKLKMSSAFHLQTDGASECSNKMVIQLLQFYVDREQKGWVHALPHICFELINSVNKSTSFSPFQLCMGRSPRVVPLVSLDDGSNLLPEEALVVHLLRQLELNCWEAQDNLLLSKVCQAASADQSRGEEIFYKLGEFVMLNTLQRCCDYMQKKDGQVAKFMP